MRGLTNVAVVFQDEASFLTYLIVYLIFEEFLDREEKHSVIFKWNIFIYLQGKITDILHQLRNVFQALNDEPNEIAEKLNLNQKTVQGALLSLANTKKDVRWKKVGRYRCLIQLQVCLL